MIDTSKIDYYMEVGKHDKDWYKDCEELFVDIFGRDKLKLVAQLFAATSINTSLKANIYLFRKALYEIEHDLPVGAYLPNIRNSIQKVRDGQELSGRKIRSFAAAMSGDKQAVVVDIWLLRAFNIDKQYMRHTGVHSGKMRSGGATDRQYTIIEEWVRDEARRHKLEPRELSSIIWAGVRIVTTGDRETHYKRLLKHQFTTLFT